MAVITVSKEFASGGVSFARKLADSLGCKLIGRTILDELAQRLGMSEAEVELLKRGQDTKWIRLVDNYLLHTVRYIAQKPEAALDDRQYFQAVQKLIQDVAAEGDVVTVGWGAQFVLKGAPGVIHLRSVAPLEMRCARLVKDRGISKEQAAEECQRQDGFSAAYIRTYFNADWSAATNYHLVLNMGALEFNYDRAVGVVKALL